MPKKVLLINPANKYTYFNIAPPHTIGYLASYLENHNINVMIADQVVEKNIFDVIDNFKPHFVGITATTELVDSAYSILDQCREKGYTTIIGGVHVSALPDEALSHSDYVVVGEGEKAILKIVSGECKKGIVKETFIENIDDIPMPAWHLYDGNFYVSFQSNPLKPKNDFLDNYPENSRIGTILGSRGCPLNCIFCYNNWKDTKIRFHSVDRVISEIEYLIENYGVNCIGFTDDNLFLSKNRIQDLSQRIIDNKYNIKWTGTSTVKNLDKETLRLAKRAGCLSVFFGFESNSQRILSILKNTKTNVDENAKAVELCKEVGMRYFGSFIFNAPTETEADIFETYNFIKKYKMKDFGIAIATPYPGTKLCEIAEKEKLFPKPLDYKSLGKEFLISFNKNLPVAKLHEYIRAIEEFKKPLIKAFSENVINAFKHPKRFFYYTAHAAYTVVRKFSNMLKIRKLKKLKL
jgi:anaerobic magnesium-protoporphyrin IX monomethyl ester cyclase